MQEAQGEKEVKKMATKNEIIPTEWISESSYRQIESIMETYHFPSIEYTINVIMDFISNHQLDGTFEDYIRKQFPSKF